MKVFIIKEKEKEIKEDNLNRFDFRDELGLNIRDLRPVFSNLQVSTILPRQNSVIINLGFLKIILTKDKAYFLNPNDSQTLLNFIENLREKIKNLKDEKNFYLFILETSFNSKVLQMNKKINNIDNNLESVLKEVQEEINDKNLEKMLNLKKRISRLENRLNEILSAAKEVLEDDENFDELISVSGDNKENRLEVESILENFIEQIEEFLGHIFRAKESLDDTDQYITLKLSSRRTTFDRLNLIATLSTLNLTFLALIAGLFGMNIKNGLEESNLAFVLIIVISIIMIISFHLWLFRFLKNRKI